MEDKQAKIIDGIKIAERIKDEIVKEVLALNQGKVQNAEIRPNLAIILVGDNKESRLYVDKKLEAAKKVGIDTHLYCFSEEDSQTEIIKAIQVLNNDDEIDAILVQLPLPNKFDTDKIIKAVDYKKDVDCFHPKNQERKRDKIIAPVHGAVLEILAEARYDIENKKALIVSNSKIFGKNLEKILVKKGAEVERILAKDKNLQDKIFQTDLLITAVGKPYQINQKMLKKNCGIIDIGISRENGKIKGDIDPRDLTKKAKFFTPVPGGVGPITVAILLKNTLELFKIKLKN